MSHRCSRPDDQSDSRPDESDKLSLGVLPKSLLLGLGLTMSFGFLLGCTSDDSREPDEKPAVTESESSDTRGRGRPNSIDCRYIDEAADGVYDLGAPGTVQIGREGDTLSLVKLTPAPGWTTKVDDEDGDEIEVDFNKGNERIEFEAEIEDDGSLKVETCVVTF